uniref:Uncharacterized protein n=1 Tax=Nicotiana tabacum TaxID=4097 RepID=A0A1S4CQZ8_TOBAC|nr:PREDICTED: uncharacterized protein LOC107821609 [Nicotiana tabacum]
MAEGEPTNSITSWNDLARKSLARDCPHHNQTNEVLAHTFIEGLLETKIVVDVAVGGQVLEKILDEIYALLNKFSKSNPDWQEEMGRHTVQKSAGVIELDIVSVLSAQIATLANQVNQMTLVINKQQAQPIQQVQIFCEMLKKLMADHQAQAAAMRNLERQMGQLASAQNTRPVGALPSNTEANTKASINVVSLRNRRQLEEISSKKRKQVTFHEKPTTVETESEKAKESEKPVEEVQINIPLVDILQEVPKYAKYIKDIVANKRRLTEFDTVALTEGCSSRIQSKLPQKLKDPVFRQLGLGEQRPTTVILQLADRSLAHPEGVIVLVQVGSFIFPADFIILDYEPDQEVLFILGCPFLATGRAIIDVCEGKMTMRVGNQVEVFNVYKALRFPAHYEELSIISVVESDMTSLVPYMRSIDPLERALIGMKKTVKMR